MISFHSLFVLSYHPAVESRLLQYFYQFLPCSSSPSLPGPPGLFLIGNMMELTHDHLPIHLTDLAQRYGNIYRLKCGNTSNHPVSDLLILHNFIKTHAYIKKTRQLFKDIFFVDSSSDGHHTKTLLYFFQLWLYLIVVTS